MKTLSAVFVLSTLGLSSITMASTGTITINGKIYNETCILSGDRSTATGTGNVIVTLNNIPSSNFSDSQRISGLKDFSVELTKTDGTACYINTTVGINLAPIVTLSTSSSADYKSDETSALVNKASTNSVTNPVYVQILAKPNATSAGAVIDYNNTGTQAKAPYDALNNRFYYAAQYYAGTGVDIPASQDVMTTVTYNITYP